VKQLQKLYDVLEVCLRSDDSVEMVFRSLPEN
jgi:hypothetical protein